MHEEEFINKAIVFVENKDTSGLTDFVRENLPEDDFTINNIFVRSEEKVRDAILSYLREEAKKIVIEKKRTIGPTVIPAKNALPDSFMELANNAMSRSEMYYDYNYGKSNLPSQENRSKLRKKRKKKRK